jgi:hypothetical protein
MKAKRYWPYIALVAAFGCLLASDTVWSMPYKWDVGLVPVLLVLASGVLAIPCVYRLTGTAQLAILWLGIIAFVLMGLFPPWLLEGEINEIKLYARPQYSYILNPPHHSELKAAVTKLVPGASGAIFLPRINVAVLVIQWAIVAVVTGGLIVTLRDKKKSQGPKE